LANGILRIGLNYCWFLTKHSGKAVPWGLVTITGDVIKDGITESCQLK